MVARQLYHPYGTTRYSEGTLATDFGFTGQRKDSSTGLVFMHARYYHPALGRFVSADTIVPNLGNPQDLNRYAYVNNNPLRYTDPSGHQGKSWEEEFEAEHGRAPNEQDRWDYAFSQQVHDFSGWEATYEIRQLFYAVGFTFESSPDRRWTMDTLDKLYGAVKAMSDAMGGADTFRNTVGDTVFKRVGDKYIKDGGFVPAAFDRKHTISVYDGITQDSANNWVSSGVADITAGHFVHELAHRWDRKHGWWGLSREFQKVTGGTTSWGRYTPGLDTPSEYAKTDRKEDFAESVRFFLFPAGMRDGYQLSVDRSAYVEKLLTDPP
ncbi:MAG: RHS repeat-associated core domain-containing protein [Aestuariibacter sp.]|nr:RHS repeat-associated core domain-containing protein [Aestuariibacter sp.]